MEKEDVLREIDRRIKRLNAVLELETQQVSSDKKFKELPKQNTTLMLSLLLSVVWIGGGLFLLYFVESRYGISGFTIPLKVYLLFFLIFLIPPVYFYVSRRRPKENPVHSDAPLVVIERFYKPLRKALEADDLETIESLASALVEDPLLASSFREAHEGNPKEAAYALYTYVRFRQGLLGEDELETAMEAVQNRAMRAMLSYLVKEETKKRE